jgi:hypothetical protein
LALRVNLLRILQTLTYREITGYQIRYSTVLWFLELQIRFGRHTVDSNSRTANCHCSLVSNKKIFNYPDGSPSQLIRNGVLLYFHVFCQWTAVVTRVSSE